MIPEKGNELHMSRPRGNSRLDWHCNAFERLHFLLCTIAWISRVLGVPKTNSMQSKSRFPNRALQHTHTASVMYHDVYHIVTVYGLPVRVYTHLYASRLVHSMLFVSFRAHHPRMHPRHTMSHRFYRWTMPGFSNVVSLYLAVAHRFSRAQ